MCTMGSRTSTPNCGRATGRIGLGDPDGNGPLREARTCRPQHLWLRGREMAVSTVGGDVDFGLVVSIPELTSGEGFIYIYIGDADIGWEVACKSGRPF